MPHDFDSLRDRLRQFAAERGWGRSHSPRNLILALTGEVGELSAELQWVDDCRVRDHLADPIAWARIKDEVADVLIYLVQFADACDIDLLAEAYAKIVRNETRYPLKPLCTGESTNQPSWRRDARSWQPQEGVVA